MRIAVATRQNPARLGMSSWKVVGIQVDLRALNLNIGSLLNFLNEGFAYLFKNEINIWC